MQTFQVKILRAGGKPYFGRVYEDPSGKFYGMVWDDFDVNILQTQEFDNLEETWENMRHALQAVLGLKPEEVGTWLPLESGL